jgi:methyl-accepting chemotaxis protein
LEDNRELDERRGESTSRPYFQKTAIEIVIALLAGFVIVFFIVSAIAKPLRILNDTSRKISEGDLRNQAEINSKDEFGELAASLNQMVDSLRSVLAEVSESSNQLAASSEQLSASAEQTSKATEHIAGTVEQMSDGANEQAHTVKDSAKTIHEVSGKIQKRAHSRLPTPRRRRQQSRRRADARYRRP